MSSLEQEYWYADKDGNQQRVKTFFLPDIPIESGAVIVYRDMEKDGKRVRCFLNVLSPEDAAKRLVEKEAASQGPGERQECYVVVFEEREAEAVERLESAIAIAKASQGKARLYRQEWREGKLFRTHTLGVYHDGVRQSGYTGETEAIEMDCALSARLRVWAAAEVPRFRVSYFCQTQGSYIGSLYYATEEEARRFAAEWNTGAAIHRLDPHKPVGGYGMFVETLIASWTGDKFVEHEPGAAKG